MVSGSELGEVEALLGRVLADPSGFLDKVVQELIERLSATNASHPTVVPGYDAGVHQQLADQNLILAAALGACDCWGADPTCAVCSGGGAAGWTEPDPDLFTEYVLPAVIRAGTPAPETPDHPGAHDHPDTPDHTEHRDPRASPDSRAASRDLMKETADE